MKRLLTIIMLLWCTAAFAGVRVGNDAGANTGSSNIENTIYYSKLKTSNDVDATWIATQDGIVDSIGGYFKKTSTGAMAFKMALYDTSGNLIDSTVWDTNSDGNGVSNWYVLPTVLKATITNGNSYHPAAWSQSSTSSLDIWYSTDLPAFEDSMAVQSLSFGGWPDPASPTLYFSGRRMKAFYYIADAATGNPRKRKITPSGRR